MLPIETFADVICYLEYYDLGGLKLANKLLSDVANQCADAIRIFDFSEFSFILGDTCINVWRDQSDRCSSLVCQLQFANEINLTQFISEAFRNSIIRRLGLMGKHHGAMRAIKVIAKTIVATDMQVIFKDPESAQELFEFLDALRRFEV